jgi:hypothetical protein
MPPDEPQQQIEAEGTPAPEARPEWLPEQFKSPEDLARSYDEMRRETDRVREEARKDREQFAEALALIEAQPAQQQAPYNPSQDPLVARYQEALENGDAATAFAIQLAVSQQQTEELLDRKFKEFQPAISAQEEAQRDTAFTLAQERMQRQYGDRWEELQPQVFDRLRQDQRLLPQAASVDGYAMAMIEQANIIEAGRIVTERQAEERDRAAKLAAQGLTGTTSRGGPPTDAAKAAWKEVQDAPTSSFADLLNRAGR